MSFLGIELPKAPTIAYAGKPAKVLHIDFFPTGRNSDVVATIVIKSEDGAVRHFRLLAEEVG